MAADSRQDEHSAGGVPYRVGADGGLEILCLERPRYSDWSLPKGHIEEGETPQEAALRELTEETGVRGEIKARLATVEYPITGRSGRPATKVVDHYLIEVAPDSPPAGPQPSEQDIPHWLPFKTAVAAMTHEADANSIRRAAVALLGPGR
ncbi:MAG: NUDIX hydrolase [Chloroflexia bacterium]